MTQLKIIFESIKCFQKYPRFDFGDDTDFKPKSMLFDGKLYDDCKLN